MTKRKGRESTKGIADRGLAHSIKPHILPLAVILVITFLLYNRSFSYPFMTWDDDEVIVENTAVQSLNIESLKIVFSQSYFGNYIPLTMTTYMIDYAIGGLSANQFHFTNLLLHALNIICLYILLIIMFRSKYAAFGAAAVFAFHPLAIEPVVWLSARNTLLYSLFFLMSIIFYLQYIRRQEKIYLWYALAAFIVSLLSKSNGIVLPFILLAVDYYEDRRNIRQLLIEKLPFFLLSVVFIAITYFVRETSGHIWLPENYSFLQRILFVTHGFSFYIIKFFFPSFLSGYYPFPSLHNGTLPIEFYCSPVLIIALGILIYRFRKQRLFILGILFFVLNLLPVIRIVPFGGAITADRYAYMPMIGILFLIPLMIPHKQDLKQLKIAIGILAMFALYLAGANIYRLPVWESDKSFYTDILERYPSSQIIRLKRAYAAQAVNKDFQSSIADYDTLIMNDPKYIDAYVQRALVHKAMGDSLSALTDANTALKLKPNMPDVYHFRSSLNFMMNNYEQAVRDCDSAQKYHTGMMAESYYTEAYVFERMGNPAAAKDNYLKAIESNPDYLDAYINLGAIDLAMKDFESAKKNYTEVMRLAPQNPLPYLQRGKAFLALGDTANAVRDFQMFKTSGYNNADSILNVLKK